jgi:hypothetical protein
MGGWVVDTYIGCSITEVVYTYEINDSVFSRLYERPFISPYSAEDYAVRFPKGSRLIIRTEPGKPEVSVVFVGDQKTMSIALL